MEHIRIEQVGKQYGHNKRACCVLQDIDLTWQRGESLALCGESGSGKSTLARLILGLERPSSGEIWFGAQRQSSLTRRQWRESRSMVQGVFQDASGSLNPAWSTMRNLEEALYNLTGMDGSARRKEIESLMAHLQLDSALLETPVHQLSGGEQRRIALVRALAVKPSFLVLDEVMAGLDFLSADAVLHTLEQYRLAFGCGYLLITHDAYSAERLGDTIYQMEHGRLRQLRPASDHVSGKHEEEINR